MNPWTKVCSPIREDDEEFPLWEIYGKMILETLDIKDWKPSGLFLIPLLGLDLLSSSDSCLARQQI